MNALRPLLTTIVCGFRRIDSITFTRVRSRSSVNPRTGSCLKDTTISVTAKRQAPESNISHYRFSKTASLPTQDIWQQVLRLTDLLLHPVEVRVECSSPMPDHPNGTANSRISRMSKIKAAGKGANPQALAVLLIQNAADYSLRAPQTKLLNSQITSKRKTRNKCSQI